MPQTPQQFPPGTPVVAYIRDSGHEDQELSTQQQERAILDWCIKNNLLLTRYFIDAAAPGSNADNRYQFQQMISYFHQKNPKPPEKMIIVWRLNRFARNIEDAQYYKADLRRLGYDIRSINDTIPEGPIGRIFETIIEWKDQEDLRTMSVDITRGLNDLIRSTGALGGTPPRGFKRETITISDHRDGKPHHVAKWIPDPELIETVKLAWTMKLAGASNQEILARTNLYKSKTMFTRFFQNPIYKGEMRFGDQVIKNYCDPIIDEASWDAAQKIIQKDQGIQSQSHPRTKNSSYPLSSMLICARCGSMLIGKTVAFKADNKPPRKYYICGNRERSRSCDLPIIPAAHLNNMVIDQIMEILHDPAWLDDLVELTNAELERLQADERNSLPNQKVALTSIEKKISRLTDAIAEYGPSKAITEKLHALERDRAALQDQIARENKYQPITKAKVMDLSGEIAGALQDAVIRNDAHGINAQLKQISKDIIIDVHDSALTGFIQYSIPSGDGFFCVSDSSLQGHKMLNIF